MRLGAGHVNGGDCLFDGGFLRTDDSDDGRPRSRAIWTFRVEFDCECVGGHGAVKSRRRCWLRPSRRRIPRGRKSFGVALSDECECVVHGDGAADPLLGEG